MAYRLVLDAETGAELLAQARVNQRSPEAEALRLLGAEGVEEWGPPVHAYRWESGYLLLWLNPAPNSKLPHTDADGAPALLRALLGVGDQGYKFWLSTPMVQAIWEAKVQDDNISGERVGFSLYLERLLSKTLAARKEGKL